MLEQHEVAAYLLERGLLCRTSVVSGALRVSDATESLANEMTLYRRLSAPGGPLEWANIVTSSGAVKLVDREMAGPGDPARDGWPCGAAAGGWAPDLLGGHAGVGLLYLRLHDGGVPSPLHIGALVS